MCLNVVCNPHSGNVITVYKVVKKLGETYRPLYFGCDVPFAIGMNEADSSMIKSLKDWYESGFHAFLSYDDACEYAGRKCYDAQELASLAVATCEITCNDITAFGTIAGVKYDFATVVVKRMRVISFEAIA